MGDPIVTVEAVPRPLSQLYDPLPFAVTLIDGCVQVNIVVALLFVILAVGAVIFCEILIVAVEEQPFVPVTVTV